MIDFSLNYKKERVIVLSLILFFLIACLALASRWPEIWQDEVMFADPAVNLFLGNGFTSTAWPVQPKGDFWAGNSPLFTVLIYIWIKIWGFGIISVRSLNYIIYSIAVLIVWNGIYKSKLYDSSYYRILLICILLTGAGMAFCYRSVRYDCLTILLSVLAFYSFTFSSLKLRHTLLFLISIFFALAGLQLIYYFLILSAISLFIFRFSYIREIFYSFLGTLTGFILLLGFLNFNGVLLQFISSVKYLATLGHNQNRILGILKSTKFGGFNADKSFQFLLILSITLALYSLILNYFSRKSLNFKPFDTYCFTTSFIIPLLMFSFSKYPIYYSWMSFIPLSIGICSILSQNFYDFNKYLKSYTMATIIFACIVGAPNQMIGILNEWESRDYSLMNSFIEKNTSMFDSIYSDYSPYYSLKRYGREAYFQPYLRVMDESEKISIDTLIIQPKSFKEVAKQFPGRWIDTQKKLTTYSRGFLNPQKKSKVFSLAIYRRSVP